MPKTNDKDAYFFSHDCNARNDPKILALRSVYGAEGYGVYFMLVEILREQPEYKLSVTKYIWSTLAITRLELTKERATSSYLETGRQISGYTPATCAPTKRSYRKSTAIPWEPA